MPPYEEEKKMAYDEAERVNDRLVNDMMSGNIAGNQENQGSSLVDDERVEGGSDQRNEEEWEDYDPNKAASKR